MCSEILVCNSDHHKDVTFMRKKTERNGSGAVLRLTILSITANALLAVFKLAAALVSSSTVLLADAVNTTSDVFILLLFLTSIIRTEKALDSDRELNRARLIDAAKIVLSVLLFFTGAFIVYRSVTGILAGTRASLPAPGLFAMIAALISVVGKELLYRLSRRTAVRMQSNALEADAWDHRRDALTSAGSFLAIAGARLGFPILDPVAGLAVCALLFKISIDLLLDIRAGRRGGPIDEKTVENIRALLLSECIPGLLDVTVSFYRSKLLLDVKTADIDHRGAEQNRETADMAHRLIEEAYPLIREIVIRIYPVHKQ